MLLCLLVGLFGVGTAVLATKTDVLLCLLVGLFGAGIAVLATKTDGKSDMQCCV